jgi:hypothetical protein
MIVIVEPACVGVIVTSTVAVLDQSDWVHSEGEHRRRSEHDDVADGAVLATILESRLFDRSTNKGFHLQVRPLFPALVDQRGPHLVRSCWSLLGDFHSVIGIRAIEQRPIVHGLVRPGRRK